MEIRQWLEVVCRQFFTNQFKRSAAQRAEGQQQRHDDGPRGTAGMPSDASPAT